MPVNQTAIRFRDPDLLAADAEHQLADYQAARAEFDQIATEYVAIGAELVTLTDAQPGEREAALARIMAASEEFPEGRSRTLAEKLLKLDPDYLAVSQRHDRLKRRREELDYRLRSQGRKLDHLERTADLALLRLRAAVVHEAFNARNGGTIG
jgi:hypothetical protein